MNLNLKSIGCKYRFKKKRDSKLKINDAIKKFNSKPKLGLKLLEEL